MFHYIDCPLFMSPPEQCSGGDIYLGHLPATFTTFDINKESLSLMLAPDS